ncbi:hypothetical protein K2D_21770 [Planctomycetes bacterium K2D]|uniref:Gylcosyl hydrolase 115 C-terminal domain-containing protein n=1 Tax=Botrimarina mediterranea TaxID=2528022 RepID=A0A518K832_9BACT|nr:hypothetical protein Spa11_21390 [Botrimarina mediterranea]QDV78570.1 hypothetical protein K2D_21770 [Planctomycetes bacterium K2D]
MMSPITFYAVTIRGVVAILIGTLALVDTAVGGGFTLIADGEPAAIQLDSAAPAGVRRVAEWFADDVERVGGKRPTIVQGRRPDGLALLVGVIGAGGEVDDLVSAGKLDVSQVRGELEASVTTVVGDVLVIAGSDKRGAIFGMLDLSREIGVSPWYWWADVPIHKSKNITLADVPRVRPAPRVRYRGVFLNDEAPALANWAQEKFGGCNSKFYAHVYELLLRLRGNFLWPAMWGRSLFDDDPESQRLADELGIVLSTSHHEPMQRAHVEWARYGKGPWDYASNGEALHEFWREGIQRMGDHESVVTLGMRGDGDMPMTDEANIDLLQQIVSDQRQILKEELGRPPRTQSQVWALYKEVQEYYDRGMKVPDDVILLLCDDNWGNVRRLPRPTDPRHPGGYGMYYHFDYVGDPRNYKWINTNSSPRVWEQMHLSWEHGVDQIWVVNVGDLKPMEAPIDFFLTMAYDPDQFSVEQIASSIECWRESWSEEQFGAELAQPIANLLARYEHLAARRKPELLDAKTYSLTSFNEWDRVVEEWRALMDDAQSLEKKLPEEARPAYFQLVLHPILAFGNLHEMYHAVANNQRFGAAGNPAANDFADDVIKHYEYDAALTRRYHELLNGKWNHMMAQTHIGYTYWQQPEVQKMPEVLRVSPTARSREVETSDPREELAEEGASGFLERDNYISINAASYSRATETDGVRWVAIPGLGRTDAGVIASPVNAPSSPAGAGPRLEYPIWLTQDGEVTVDLFLSPTQDIYGGDDHGIRLAVSIDNHVPVVLDMHVDRSTNERNPGPWRRHVADAIHIVTSPAIEIPSGSHTLKVWRVDAGPVLQKIVVKRDALPVSYLGPPESRMLE